MTIDKQVTIDKSPYRRKFAKLVGATAFLAFCLLAMLSGYLASGMDFGPGLIIHMLQTSIPFAFCLGIIAYLTGRILDKKQARSKKKKVQQLKTGDDGKIQSIFSDDSADSEEIDD